MICNIYDQLRRDEGDVSWVYDDANGKPVQCAGYATIGVGFLVDKQRGGGLDDDEIDYILKHRVAQKRRALGERYPWMARLDMTRRGVFENMCYQLGIAGLAAFENTLACAERQDWPGTAAAMLDSKWARQTPKRAQRLAKQIKTGVWQ